MESMCRNCRNFFGSQEGYCSQCFKLLCHKPTPQVVISEAPVEEKKNSVGEAVQISSDRCQQCSKKLGPMHFSCKCKGVYCSRHRLPEEHQCSYDHMADGKRKLSEENPVVMAQKFNKLT